MHENPQIGNCLYITPNIITSVPVYYEERKRLSVNQINNQVNLKQNYHNNKLSVKTVRKIKKAVNWLCVSAKPKTIYDKKSNKYFEFTVNLITLTLPDTKNEINDIDFKKKLLHPFLVYMKKYFGLRNYVWKLEFQKNGKIHAHLTTDTFIHWQTLKKYWNSLLRKSGYLEEFREKFGHDEPNSTDVHAIYKIKNIAAYIAKYLSKQIDEGNYINGRFWGCNYELSDSNKCKLELIGDECREEMRQLFQPEIDYKDIVTQDKTTGKIYRNAECFFIKLNQWGVFIKGRILEAYENHKKKIANNTGFSMQELSI